MVEPDRAGRRGGVRFAKAFGRAVAPIIENFLAIVTAVRIRRRRDA